MYTPPPSPPTPHSPFCFICQWFWTDKDLHEWQPDEGPLSAHKVKSKKVYVNQWHTEAVYYYVTKQHRGEQTGTVIWNLGDLLSYNIVFCFGILVRVIPTGQIQRLLLSPLKGSLCCEKGLVKIWLDTFWWVVLWKSAVSQSKRMGFFTVSFFLVVVTV